jgi:Superinfection immunity protein
MTAFSIALNTFGIHKPLVCRAFMACTVLCLKEVNLKSPTGNPSMNTGVLEMDFMLTVVVAAVLITVYFLPTIIAKKRDILHFGMLFTINLLLGWTAVGWFLCMLWGIFGQTVEAHKAIMSVVPRPQSRG